MALMQTSFYELSNSKIAVYKANPKGLPQLFCVHGGMGLGADSLIRPLSSLGKIFDLIFIDLRGCGQSSKALNDSYRLEDFAGDIEQVAKMVLRPDTPAGIFGHSMGGMVAIQTLASFPDLFTFGILANSAIDSSWIMAADKAIDSIASLELQRVSAAYTANPTKENLKGLALQYASVYFPELSPLSAAEEMDKYSYRPDSLSFLDTRVYPTMDLKVIAAKVSAPTLVLSGELDAVVPFECQQLQTSYLIDSIHEVIPKAGHFPFTTQTGSFATKVERWWSGVSETNRLKSSR